jgi:hypothetical protein
MTHPRPETDREKFAALLISGANIGDAAAALGISRTTATRWRDSVEVADAIEAHRRDVRASISTRLTTVAATALERAESLLDDPETPPTVVVRLLATVLAEARLRADVDEVLRRLEVLEARHSAGNAEESKRELLAMLGVDE